MRTTPLTPRLRAILEGIAISPEIHAQWPEFRVMLVIADGIKLDSASLSDVSPLDIAERETREREISDWTTNPHVAQWMDAYRAFGAKPQRTRPSVFGLLRRIEAGLPRIDPITDLYNAISISHVLPVGGEDLHGYRGAPRLTFATGEEPFDTTESGEQVIEHPVRGEVIWRDDEGVTCRRWNWRQGIRTRLSPDTTTAVFILEALDAMSDEALAAAGTALVDGLQTLSPGVSIGTRTIRHPD